MCVVISSNNELRGLKYVVNILPLFVKDCLGQIFFLLIFFLLCTTYNVIGFFLSCTWLLHMLHAIGFGYKMHSFLTELFLSTHTKSTILDCIDTTSINSFLY